MHSELPELPKNCVCSAITIFHSSFFRNVNSRAAAATEGQFAVDIRSIGASAMLLQSCSTFAVQAHFVTKPKV